jgi:hypothetical protein
VVLAGAGISILVSMPLGDPWDDLEALTDLVGKENVVRVVFWWTRWEWVCSSRFASDGSFYVSFEKVSMPKTVKCVIMF